MVVPRVRILALMLAALLLVDAARIPQHLEVLQVVESLGSLLDLLIAHPEQVIADTLFGVVLARGQLDVWASHLRRGETPVDPRTRSLLRRLDQVEEKCETVLKMHPLRRVDSRKPGSQFGKVAERLLRPELWRLDAPFTAGALQSHSRPIRANPRKTGPRARAPVDSGTPDEAQSDRCLAQLVEMQPRCGISQECRDWEDKDPPPTGYRLTHRLIYLQTARQVGCMATPIQGGASRRLCGLILREAQSIADEGFPAYLRDLFIEQVALCGMEGFLEFLTPEWRRALLSWQRPEGCFGQPLDTGIHNRTRRSDLALEGSGCRAHMDGVAVAALAVNLRSMIEGIIGVA